MTIKVSTGLRNAMLAVGTLKATLDDGFIDLYAGPEPLTADAAIGSEGTNDKLCRISVDGDGVTGITFDAAAVSGALSKNPAETWKGTNLLSGTATFYRHVTPTDTGASSATEERIQGDIATVLAAMNISNPNLVAAAEQTLSSYVVALPTL